MGFETMNGKEFIYEGTKILVKEVKKDGKEYRVLMGNGKVMYASRKELEEDFQEVVEKGEVSLMKNVREANSGLSVLGDKLMKMMEKIESDKTFIPQAEAMNKVAKNMIDLAKVQVSAVVAMRKK